MNSLKFGERIPKSSVISLVLFFGLVVFMLGVFVPTMPNLVARTDLDIATILRQEFRDPTYAKLELPELNQAPQTLFVEYEGDFQEVEFLPIRTQVINGRSITLIASRLCDEEADLETLANSGSLPGVISKNSQFSVEGMATIKAQYPALDFDHYCLLEVDSNQISSSLLFCLTLTASLGIFVMPIRRVIAGWKNERIWKSNVHWHSAARKSQMSTIEPDLVVSRFVFPNIDEPRTSRFWSGLIRAIYFWLFVFVVAMLRIAIENPMANLWLCLSVLVGFVFLVVYQFRILPLADLWSPIDRFQSCSKLAFVDSGFHVYHRNMLSSLGFRSLGDFKNKKKTGMELLISPDKTLVAELGQTKTKNREKHFCSFSSYFDNTTSQSTSVNEVASEYDLGSTPDPTGMFVVALDQHIRMIRHDCKQNDVRVIALEDWKVVEVMALFATLNRIHQLETHATKHSNGSKRWAWAPEWMITPLMLPSANGR